MSEEDVEELQQEYTEARSKKRTKHKVGTTTTTKEDPAEPTQAPLSLGYDLLLEDEAFAMICAVSIMQVRSFFE